MTTQQPLEHGIVTIHNSTAAVRVARRYPNGYVDYRSAHGSGWFAASDGDAQTFVPAAGPAHASDVAALATSAQHAEPAPKFTASGTPLPAVADTPGRRAAIDQMHTEAILEDMARDERAAAEPAPCAHPATARRYSHQGPGRVAWCHSCGDELD